MTNGQLTPAEKPTFVSLARQIHGRESSKVRLAKGGTESPEESPWEMLTKLCSSLSGDRFSLGETPGMRSKPSRPGSPVQQAADRSSETREERITAYMDKHGVDRSAAIQATAAGLREGDPPRRRTVEVTS